MELTRLPFVESSFNVHAYSKVGAAGIWQFIPSSARIYLRAERGRGFAPRSDLRDARGRSSSARRLRRARTVGRWRSPHTTTVAPASRGRSNETRLERHRDDHQATTMANRSDSLHETSTRSSWRPSRSSATTRPLRRGEVRAAAPIPGSQHPRLPALLDGCQARGVQCRGAGDLNPRFTNEVFEGKLYVPKGYTMRVPAGRAKEFAPPTSSLPADRAVLTAAPLLYRSSRHARSDDRRDCQALSDDGRRDPGRERTARQRSDYAPGRC